MATLVYIFMYMSITVTGMSDATYPVEHPAYTAIGEYRTLVDCQRELAKYPNDDTHGSGYCNPVEK